MLGFTQIYPIDDADILVSVGRNLRRTLGLFVLESQSDERLRNPNIVVASILGFVATLGTIYEFAYELLSRRWNRWRLASMRNHTVIIGIGYEADCFLRSTPSDARVVAIVDSSDPGQKSRVSSTPLLRRGRVRKLEGNARDPGILLAARANHARKILILTADDTTNLEVLRRVLELKRHRLIGSAPTSPSARTHEREGERDDKELIIVRVDNGTLNRQLDREDIFVRPQTHDDSTHELPEVVPFNAARLAAVQCFAEYPLVDLAELRGQDRVHVVCIGWSNFVFAFVEQLARLAPYRQFDKPSVHLFVQDAEAVRSELASTQPVFLEDSVIRLDIEQADDASCVPSPSQMAKVEPDGGSSVTAIVVSLKSDEETAATALSVRDRSGIAGRWRAPILADVRIETALAGLLSGRTQKPDPADRIVAVGLLNRVCTLETITGERERMARRLHEAYRRTKQRQDSTRSDPAYQPWANLPQTYRIANRRAVDHLRVKLLSAGYVVAGSELRLSGGVAFGDGSEFEELAALEHKSWEIDRLLEGWRGGGVRDNQRRINPALGISYRNLPDEVQQLDRDQIFAIKDLLSDEQRRDRPATIFRELRIGLIGHNKVSRADKTRILVAFEDAFDKLREQSDGAYLTLLTPLAPGADTILAEAALRLLDRQKGSKVRYRLVVVRTLPVAAAVWDYRRHAVEGDQWRLADDGKPSEVATMVEHIATIARRSPGSIVANIEPAGLMLEDWQREAALRQEAYQRANARIVQQCDFLFAFNDGGRQGAVGGTKEAVAWALGERPIPFAFQTMRGRRRQTARKVVEIN